MKKSRIWTLAAALTVMCCSVGTVAMASPVKPTIYYYDVTYVAPLAQKERYDIYHAVFTLQGIVNRDAPRLFVRFWQYDNDADVTWLNRMREPEGVCEDWPVETIDTFEELIAKFRRFIDGVIVWDEDVISTSLVATTAAGIHDAIAVRYDTTAGSMYNYLTQDVGGPQFPILVDLHDKFTGSGTIWDTHTASTGSAKCDAYIWAKEKYLDTGLCDTTLLQYQLDAWALKRTSPINHYAQLSNMDYGVKRRGFFFELSPWGDEPATDDPTQPIGTDLNTFKAILHACNVQNNFAEMIKVIGFTNWPFKYTNWCDTNVPDQCPGGTHDPVATEWEMARLFTAYNVYKEPPFLISNMSFYAGLLPELKSRRYIQNSPPSYRDMIDRGFIDPSTGNVINGHYILLGLGDYDGQAWTHYFIGNGYYLDLLRGEFPLSWGINPNLMDTVGVVFDYMYRNKTDQDFFIAWDSGAGYLHPSGLSGPRSPSNYPSIVPVWQEHNRNHYRLLNYSITGFLLNAGANRNMTNTDLDIYTPFSGDGLGGCSLWSSLSRTRLHNNVPMVRRDGHKDNPTAAQIRSDYSSGVRFDWYRTVTPSGYTLSHMQSVMQDYANNYTNNHAFLDAYTFYYLARHHMGGHNDYRATWVDDTIPRIMEAGQTYPVTVIVRNDGWDSWSEADNYRLGHAVVSKKVTPQDTDYDARGRAFIPGGAGIASKQQVTFSFNLIAPSTPGEYDLYYDMVREGVTWFKGQNNIEWKKSIIVAADVLEMDTDGDGVPDVIEEAEGTLWWHPDDNPTPPVGMFTINNGAAFTGSNNVGLQLEAEGSGIMNLVADMRMRNENLNWSAWESYKANRGWMTTSGEGLKTVSVQFRDELGQESEIYSNTIYVDLTAPTGSISIQGGRDCVTYQDVVLSLPATDGAGSGVVEMRVRNAGESWPPIESYAPTKNWQLPTGPGPKTVQVQYRDAVGRLSTTYSDSITLAFSEADLDCSMAVNDVDLLILAEQWLNLCDSIHRCDNADTDNSGSVGLMDLAVLARFWMDSLE